MFKKATLVFLFILLFVSAAFAEERCVNCGMKIGADSKNTITLNMKDGSAKQLCSLYCYSRNKGRGDSVIKDITVNDYMTGEELPVESSVWVEGSDAPEPMGDKSHVAFKERNAAEAFARKHGGRIVTFKEALNNTLREWKH